MNILDNLITNSLNEIVKKNYNLPYQADLTIPGEEFGDFACNIAMQIAGQVHQAPLAIAQTIAKNLRLALADYCSEVSVVKPGFINFKLYDHVLIAKLKAKPIKFLQDKTYLVEFSDPNPFKILHAGHLYTSVVGDSIARLLVYSGATVKRLNYGGDVGLHVAKAIWAMIDDIGGEDNISQLDSIKPDDRSAWMSQAYVKGNQAYESANELTKEEINNLNKRIYEIQDKQDHHSNLAKLYWLTRQWSYDAFDKFYERLSIKFDKFYPESLIANSGLNIVRQYQAKGVFIESQGAIVFNAEKYGLHTRVFINSKGLPTYEAKEIGLAMAKKQDYNFDKSIIITANEQDSYMAVINKVLELLDQDLASSTIYLSHGMVRLSGGVKMSSRLGNTIIADDLLDVTAEELKDNLHLTDDRLTLGAIKYSFLKQRLGGDIIYEPHESVSITGNSGPYLQYAHARAKSILAKINKSSLDERMELNSDERSLILKLGRAEDVIYESTKSYNPHILCTYLYELAQTFNRFYEHHRVVGHKKEAFRGELVKIYAKRLADGLTLLGIEAPDKL